MDHSVWTFIMPHSQVSVRCVRTCPKCSSAMLQHINSHFVSAVKWLMAYSLAVYRQSLPISHEKGSLDGWNVRSCSSKWLNLSVIETRTDNEQLCFLLKWLNALCALTCPCLYCDKNFNSQQNSWLRSNKSKWHEGSEPAAISFLASQNDECINKEYRVKWGILRLGVKLCKLLIWVVFYVNQALFLWEEPRCFSWITVWWGSSRRCGRAREGGKMKLGFPLRSLFPWWQSFQLCGKSIKFMWSGQQWISAEDTVAVTNFSCLTHMLNSISLSFF